MVSTISNKNSVFSIFRFYIIRDSLVVADYDVAIFHRLLFAVLQKPFCNAVPFIPLPLKTVDVRDDFAFERADESHFRATVHVNASDTFWGWVFEYVGRMKVEAPEEARQIYHERLSRALED